VTASFYNKTKKIGKRKKHVRKTHISNVALEIISTPLALSKYSYGKLLSGVQKHIYVLLAVIYLSDC
jgi:hypothetical protein